MHKEVFITFKHQVDIDSLRDDLREWEIVVISVGTYVYAFGSVGLYESDVAEILKICSRYGTFECCCEDVPNA